MKKKITVTTGSRAEYGLLRPVLSEIKQSKKLNLLDFEALIIFQKKNIFKIVLLKN